jgi:hypothetical protein
MKIVQAYFSTLGGQSTLSITLEREDPDGSKWLITLTVLGTDADNLWGIWDSNKDQDIINEVLNRSKTK